MNLEEFYSDLRNLVSMRAATDGTYTSDAFMTEVAERLIDAEEVGNLEILNFTGVGKRRRKLAVNGYDLDDSDESIALAVLNYTGRHQPATISYTDAMISLKTLQAFLEDAVADEFTEDREPSTPEYQLAEDLRTRRRPVTRYRLYLITDSALSNTAKTAQSSEFNGVPVEFHIWDIKRLQQVHESVQGREELEIDLTEWESAGIPALKVTDTAGDLTTYLAALPGKMVAELYARYGSRLLEGNVRSFLSLRGRTNQGIRRTIINEPANFLAYNNGISATATRADTRNGNLVTLRDLQVVNGGQTTASLFYANRDAKDVDLSDVFIQMKLVVVEPEKANEMIPLISRFTNSQNTVSEADFFSNHPFHVRMEELSKRVLAPAKTGVNFQTKWYYERTRGQHQNEKNKRTSAEQKKFEAEYPRAQLITKTDAAKFEVSWGRQPHQVSAGAQKNFRAYAEIVAKDFNSSEAKYKDTYFKEMVSKAILFQSVRAAISKADWYESGMYLANLTTYAIAKLSLEVSRQPRAAGFRLSKIWDQQAVSPTVISETVAIARLVLDVLDAKDRPVSNVTEWAKRKQCWDEVAGLHYTLTDRFLGECIDVPTNASGRPRVTVGARFNSSISETRHVQGISAERWQQVSRFLRERRRLSSSDQRLLLAVMGPSRRVLDPNEATDLLKLFVKAENEGFVSQ